MTSNFLFLNSQKTEVIVFGPKIPRNMVSNQILTLDGITLASSNIVRNLGTIFDHMSFNMHMKHLCGTAFLHFHNRYIYNHQVLSYVKDDNIQIFSQTLILLVVSF